MDYFVTPNLESLYGADDSATIQNAIAEAERNGYRKVVIPRYNARMDRNEWRIARCIRIPDHFTVILDNCYMVQETGVFQHMFANSRFDDLEFITKAENEQQDITLLGRGNVVLDGGVHNRLLEKTSGKFGMPTIWENQMLFWVNVNGLHVENLHVENQRWWAMAHVFCRNVKLKNLDFFAIPHVPTMDGVDMRTGCHHFEIENITGRTGDDVVACTAMSGWGETHWKVQGKETDIHDIKIRNIKADCNTCYCLRILNHDGHKIYNIDADTIMDASDYATKHRSGTALGIGHTLYARVSQNQPGDTYNIHARNITSRSENAVMCCNALKDSVISNVKTFGDNINGLGYNKNMVKKCFYDNVTFEHFWYGARQQEILQSTALPPEKYHGVALMMNGMTGKLKLKDIHIDQVRTAVELDGGGTVEIEGYSCNRAFEEFKVGKESTLIINGEVLDHA